jgi:hypothetical protein
MVGDLYHEGDNRRDGAFTIFYMGINIGGLLAGLYPSKLALGELIFCPISSSKNLERIHHYTAFFSLN